MTGLAGRPVLSQRFVRAIAPPTVPEQLKTKEFVVLGSDDAALRYFESHGLRVSSHLDSLSPDTHVVVVWDASRLSQDEKLQAKSVNRFLDEGGKMVVLATSRWDWPELCDIQIKHDPRFSRVFPYRELKEPWLKDIDPQWLIRWNGLPGTVAVGDARRGRHVWCREDPMGKRTRHDRDGGGPDRVERRLISCLHNWTSNTAWTDRKTTTTRSRSESC